MRMDAHAWLDQVRKLDRLIDAKIAERERLVAIATDISPGAIDGMPYSNTGTVSQKMQNAVINLIMLADEINKLIDQYVDYKAEVLKVLETLPEKEYTVLHMYYIRGMTLEQIAEKTGKSDRHVKRIKKKGLNILGHVLECHPKKWYNV